ncbi:regulatory protein RecX [Qipengyuania sp. SM2507]
MDHADRPRKAKRRQPRPLDPARLEELALAYVARFATTAGKLRTYLQRKLRERGWTGEELAEEDEDTPPPPDIETLIERFVAQGYVDDAGYARMRSADLLRRGYGARRVSQQLMQAGIAEDLREDVAPGEAERRAAALALARKRRFGSFGLREAREGEEAHRLREKQLAAMVRAGHDFEHARRVLDAATPDDLVQWVEEAREDSPS